MFDDWGIEKKKIVCFSDFLSVICILPVVIIYRKLSSFFFVLIHLAAVIKTEQNLKTGEHVSSVVAYLNKGKTFGVSEV